MERDPYSVLGVGPDASQADIKQAFRERALECHPDRADDHEKAAAKDEFLRVQEAFDVLSDPEKRAAYDASGSDGSTEETAPPPRTRSFKDEWRRRSGRVRVRRSIFENVNGLWATQEVVNDRTSVAVYACAVLGFGLFLYDPHFIYGTGVYLIDLAFCTLLGGAHGYVLGSLWGHLDLLRGNEATES